MLGESKLGTQSQSIAPSGAMSAPVWQFERNAYSAIGGKGDGGAAPATTEAKAAICSPPRAPGGSASEKSTKPAAIGTAFVTNVAMPAAVSALPCWNAVCSTLVPTA